MISIHMKHIFIILMCLGLAIEIDAQSEVENLINAMLSNTPIEEDLQEDEAQEDLWEESNGQVFEIRD